MHSEDLAKVTEVFLNSGGKEDVELVRELEQRGFDTHTAEGYVAFMPIAFGRVLIRQMAKVSFSDKYCPTEDSTERSLTDEEVYLEAFRLASESSLGEDVFAAIAMRSAELKAIHQALEQNADVDGGEFGPVVLFGYETLGRAKVG